MSSSFTFHLHVTFLRQKLYRNFKYLFIHIIQLHILPIITFYSLYFGYKNRVSISVLLGSRLDEKSDSNQIGHDKDGYLIKFEISLTAMEGVAKMVLKNGMAALNVLEMVVLAMMVVAML